MPSLLALAVPAVLLLGLSACAQQGHTDGPDLADPGAGPGTWTEITGSPLSGRDDPVVANVAGELVVVGGYAGPGCPPGADCAYVQDDERDGAAYSFTTHTWHAIADAPEPVAGWTSPAVVGDRLYLLVEGALLSWDSSEDAWRERPVPGHARGRGLDLTVDGRRLILTSGSDEHGVLPDRTFDTRTGEWSELPPNPLAPSFDRTITATPAGLVLTGDAIDAGGNPVDPSLVHAAVLAPGATTWRELPLTGQLASGPWSWTGTRLVAPVLGGADGGEVDDYGRTIPFGGRLDPMSGAWSPLPPAPTEGTRAWPVQALAGARMVMAGWLYDDAAGTWTRLPRPAEAPEEPGPAIWAGPRLLVYGGGSWQGETYVRSTSAWMLSR